jgi:hypothetical protein
MKTLIRPKKLEELYDAIMNRKNVYLEAPLGYGASFLLNRLEERLVNRRVYFRFTLNSSPKFNAFKGAFFAELEKHAQQRPNLSFQLNRFYQEKSFVTMQDFSGFYDCLNLLKDHLQQVGLDFLFVFEHIDEWNLGAEEKNLLDTLGELVKARNVQVLINSSASLKLPSSIGLETYHLSKALPNDIWDSPSSTEHSLYDFSQGNLHLLNALISKEKTEAQESIDALLKEVHPIFKLFRHRFTALQWKLLQAIAIEERVEQPHAFAFLVKYNLGAASSIERALQNLLTTKLIRRNESAYFIQDQLLMRWLQWLVNQ